jgi:hypothetical protein
MNANDVLKTYAIFYVSENDEFDTAKKLDMLNFIEQSDEMMLMDLFENGEIEAPFDLLDEVEDVEEKDVATLIGESVIMLAEVDQLLEQTITEKTIVVAAERLKDMLGMKTSLTYKIAKATGKAKEALQTQLNNLTDKIGALKSSIAKTGEKAVKAGGEALEKGKEMVGDAGEAVSKGAKSVGKAVKGVTDDAGKVIGKGLKSVQDVAGQASDKVAGAAGKAAEFAQNQPGMVGAAVAAAAALTAGVMAYRRFFSKAAKACKTSPDRAQCLAQYKMKAKQAQISALNAGKAKCAKTSKPEQCKAKIDGKINTLKAKMRG